MFYNCGRKIKVKTGEQSQTVNICTSDNIHGKYEYVVRFRPPISSVESIVTQPFDSIEDLVRHLETTCRGVLETRPREYSRSTTHADVKKIHPLLEGLEAIYEGCRRARDRDGLFRQVFQTVRQNWTRAREVDRWPTASNWVLRVQRDFTFDATGHLEKQLQKQIAICLENEGWGNDVPTASGLVNSGGR